MALFAERAAQTTLAAQALVACGIVCTVEGEIQVYSMAEPLDQALGARFGFRPISAPAADPPRVVGLVVEFDDLTASAAAGLTAAASGLVECVLEGDLPCEIAAGSSRTSGVVHFTLDLTDLTALTLSTLVGGE